MPSWRVVSFELLQNNRGDLVGPLRQAVRREGQPAVAAARAAWMGVQVTSSRGGVARPDRSTRLRARVAAATRTQITPTGIRITVAAARVDPVYGRALPWYLGGYGRPWRHPVMGNRRVWAVQRGEQVFFETIAAHRPAFEAGIRRAMEEVARNW